jgi:hypothetical protein
MHRGLAVLVGCPISVVATVAFDWLWAAIAGTTFEMTSWLQTLGSTTFLVWVLFAVVVAIPIAFYLRPKIGPLSAAALPSFIPAGLLVAVLHSSDVDRLSSSVSAALALGVPTFAWCLTTLLLVSRRRQTQIEA